MKIFVVSDIHGDYNALIKSLDNAGYNSNDNNHLLIVCGDMFDRGSESLKVYKYLKDLNDRGRAVIVRGNHEGILINYLSGKNVSAFDYINNGTNETFADFLHQTAPFETYCVLNDIEYPNGQHFYNWLSNAVKSINEEYPELLPWLQSLPYYYETKKYIFTHGAIDTTTNDWKNNFVDWEMLMWDSGLFFGTPIKNTDKTVVIGHFSTKHLRSMYAIDDGKDQHDILVRDDNRVIAIDTCTTLTHRVNVLTVEDILVIQ